MQKYSLIAALAVALSAVSVDAASAQAEPASGPVAVETPSAPAGADRLEARWRTPFAVESSGRAPIRQPRVAAAPPEPVSPPEAGAAESAPEAQETAAAPAKPAPKQKDRTGARRGPER